MTTKIHLCSSSDKFALVFLLSAGNKNDAPEGRKLIQTIRTTSQHYLVADRAYEDRMTREISAQQGFIFVVPPKKNRKQTWNYDTQIYKRRNEIERYFRRLKSNGKVFTRYDKLDVMFISVIKVAMIFDALLM